MGILVLLFQLKRMIDHCFMDFVLFFRHPILTRCESLKFTIYTNFDLHDSVFSACLSTSNQMLGFHETKVMSNENPGFGGKKEQRINQVKDKTSSIPSLGSSYL